MSVHVISWVLRNSKERLGNRLVLIVLADHAHGDGTNCWPAVSTIAAEAHMSERAVRYALRSLEKNGSITKTGRHESGTNIYSVEGVQDLQGGQSTTPDVLDFAPKPLEPSLKSSPGRTNGELVANYVDHAALLGITLPRQVVGAAAQQVGKLTAEGQDPRWIRRGLELLAEKGLNPASLPSLVVEAQREGAKRNGLSSEAIMALSLEETA